MVRPAMFGFNEETFASNPFQNRPSKQVSSAALLEFDRLSQQIVDHGIKLWIWQDEALPAKPDAVFPNNWFSHHEGGTLVLYPMAAPVRRLECHTEVIRYLIENLSVFQLIDLRSFEQQGKYLEGTGSIVFDHVQNKAYMALSDRSHPEVLALLSEKLRYQAISFETIGPASLPVYHTNVMLSIGPSTIVCCESVIKEPGELISQFKSGVREYIRISFDQMLQFAGNILVVQGAHSMVLLLSSSAYKSLLPNQIRQLERYYALCIGEIPTIETIGGGSLRCMLAEVF